jgi:hypothetical protein
MSKIFIDLLTQHQDRYFLNRREYMKIESDEKALEYDPNEWDSVLQRFEVLQSDLESLYWAVLNHIDTNNKDQRAKVKH